MKQDERQVDDKRRRFLGQAVAAGAGTVAAASLPGSALGAVETERQEGEKARQGYRLTRHVLDYYKSAAS
ncbi:MAG: transcriptional initiation protein Tat [Gammaproteobacteria bacterium]|nr:transcriptional initiation protein Tat [Gammaproteobacteria bacterium]